MNKCRYYGGNCRLRSIYNVLIRFMNENPCREYERFHKHFTVHKLHVKLPDLHGDRLENEFTWHTILQIGNNSVIISRELISKLLSPILSCEANSWRP